MKTWLDHLLDDVRAEQRKRITSPDGKVVSIGRWARKCGCGSEPKPLHPCPYEPSGVGSGRCNCCEACEAFCEKQMRGISQ